MRSERLEIPLADIHASLSIATLPTAILSNSVAGNRIAQRRHEDFVGAKRVNPSALKSTA